ncbi:hypothetical protein SRHO_G00022940 [Serrasalmus rhombeus]
MHMCGRAHTREEHARLHTSPRAHTREECARHGPQDARTPPDRRPTPRPGREQKTAAMIGLLFSLCLFGTVKSSDIVDLQIWGESSFRGSLELHRGSESNKGMQHLSGLITWALDDFDGGFSTTWHRAWVCV